MMGWFSAVIESRTLRGWAIVAILGAIATAMLLALAVPSFAYHEVIAPKDNNEVNKKLNELRKATDKYRVLSLSEGKLPATIVDPDDPTNVYVRPSRCVQRLLPDGSRAAMGYHYVNQADVNRDLGDPQAFTVGVGGNYLKPEALLYALSGEDNGELKLVAVEWIVRSADQKDIDPTNDEPQQKHPQLQLTEKTSVPFHNEKAPMWGHEGWPGSPYHGELATQDEWQPIHYDLHAWIWEENPDGVFQDFNRNVSCP